MSKPLKLLIVEDSKIDAVLVIDELRSGGYDLISSLRVEDPEAYKAALSDSTWDIIISDYALPRFSALKALAILQETNLDIPFIIVSGSIGEDIAVEALKKGANDYIMKDNPKRLPAAVERGIQEVNERKARQKIEAILQDTENSYRRLVEAVKDYGIFMLDPNRRVISWNLGAERITGYTTEEIIGQKINQFYPQEDTQQGKPDKDLTQSMDFECFEDEMVCVRKDGSLFHANISMNPLHNEDAKLTGFSIVIQDITERKQAEAKIRALAVELEQKVLERTTQLELVNKELESFSYSVSHDLRAPLRNLTGLCNILLSRYADQLDEDGKNYLNLAIESSQRMMQLINDLLNLSRVSQSELNQKKVNLSEFVHDIAAKLAESAPNRAVEWRIADGIIATGDPLLLRNALQNLLENAWKFTGKQANARIEFGTIPCKGENAYFVRDNGVGFDPTYQHKLFNAFQRLHGEDEFPGSGIGLATVNRIIHRHRGDIWAEGAINQGATFYFTLP